MCSLSFTAGVDVRRKSLCNHRSQQGNRQGDRTPAASKSHIVYLGARNREHGYRAVSDLKQTGDARLLLLDFVDVDSHARAAQQLKHEVGYPDGLINNAGIAPESFTPSQATLAGMRAEGFRVNAVNTGYTTTDLNNFNGPGSVEGAAAVPVKCALLEAKGAMGLFFTDNGFFRGDRHDRLSCFLARIDFSWKIATKIVTTNRQSEYSCDWALKPLQHSEVETLFSAITHHTIFHMRVLITGSAGFLGSHLTDRFLTEGHEVVGLDNFITGSVDNIAHLAGNPLFKFVRHDVSNYISVEGKVDGVLHFASPASPIDYLKYPIPTLKVGALGTHNALGVAKAKGARFLIASTSEVYGDPLVHPQTENYWGNVNPVGPRGVYDEAKRFAEAITMAYHTYHNIDTRILRIFNTYGPRMRPRDGRVVSNFIVQAIRNEPITIYGDGSQTRSFCFVSDEVDGIYKLFMHGDANPTNIGNPVEFTVKQLAELVVELTGTSAPIVYHDLPVDDPKVRQPDITKARTQLGWEPAVSLREGLVRTIQYFRGVVGE